MSKQEQDYNTVTKARTDYLQKHRAYDKAEDYYYSALDSYIDLYIENIFSNLILNKN